MPVYILAQADCDDLATAIFSAGPDSREEAVAVFTDSSTAEKYLEDAGWTSEYTIATVDAIPFMKFVLELHAQGVQHMAIDPHFADQQAGIRLDTLDIEAHLEHAGRHIMEVARPDF